MLTDQQIANKLAAAELSVDNLEYDAVAGSIKPVWEDLDTGGEAAKDRFPWHTLVRLAAVLRKWANNSNTYGYTSADNGTTEYGQAQKVLNKAFNWNPELKQATLSNEQGMLHYDRGLYDKAQWSFQKIARLEDAPKALGVRALIGMGACYRELLRFSEAEEYFGRAGARLREKSYPHHSVRLLIERGWLHFYRKEYALSLSCFEKALDDAADKNDQQEARAGQIASLQAQDSQNAGKPQDRSRELLRRWLKGSSALSKKEAVWILLTCGQQHSLLNNYPAALLAYEFITQATDADPNPIDPGNMRAWWERIDTLKWLRRYDAAESVYREAQQKFPHDIILWMEMAHVYYLQKRFQDSYDYYSGAAVAKHSSLNDQEKKTFSKQLHDDDEANEWTIVALRKMRNLPEAELKVSEALARFPDSHGLLCEKAFIRFTERKYDEAIALFDRALKIDDYYPFAYQWRAASLRKQGKFDDARKEIEAALIKLPLATYLWEELAWIAFDQNQFKEAEGYFARAIEIDPYLILRQFSRVEVLLRLNRNDDALQALLDLQAMFPEDIEVAEQLGWLYLRRGEMELADERFRFIETRESENALGLNARGGYHLKQRDYQLAAKAFRKAIKQVNYEPQYHINRAWALVRQVKEPGEMPESQLNRRTQLLNDARDCCREALKLDRFDAKAHICLGVIAFKRGALADSEGYLRKSIELSAAEGGRVELAALYVQIGRLEDAEKELAAAITRNYGDTRAHIESGNLKLLTGSNKDAIRECRIAVALEPNNDEAHRALAIALMRDGQYYEAEKILRRAIAQLGSSKRWRLHLVLSQILIRLGDDKNKDKDDKKKDTYLYSEALNQVYDALRSNPSPSADILFHAGIAHYRLADYPASRQSFDDCLKTDRDRLEAGRYSAAVQAAIEQPKDLLAHNTRAGRLLAVGCVVMLVLLWFAYSISITKSNPEAEAAATTTANAAAEAVKLAETKAAEAAKVKVAADQDAAKADEAAKGPTGPDKDALTTVATQKAGAAREAGKAAQDAEDAKVAATTKANEAAKAAASPKREVIVDKSMITLYTPILLGLIVIALLLPNLSKVTLPGGITAEIREATVEISVGPRGDVGFGSSLPIISPGPG